MASNFPSISKNQIRHIILNFSCCLILILMPSYADDVDAETDTLLQHMMLPNGYYMNSANKVFRLQFFSPGTSKSKYLGIFYNIPPKMESHFTDIYNHPVWVANRNTPVPDKLLALSIETDGLLKIYYRRGYMIVSNSTPTAKNTSATILDNGNLVLRMLNSDGSTSRTLWQSFDYPTDTLLPGMKLGINFRTGHKWSLTSWTNNEIPASGSFTLGGDPNGSSQVMVFWRGNAYWTSGLWDKGRFTNTFDSTYYNDFNFTYVSNENERYWTYSARGNISLAKVRIYSNGTIDVSRGFDDVAYSSCSFSGNPLPGCVMEMLPKCRKADLHFLVSRGSVLGFGFRYDQNQNLSLFDCKFKCRQNCSCIAFALINNNGTGCEIFNKDIRFKPSESRVKRILSSEEQTNERLVYFLDTGRGTKWWIWLVAAVGVTLLLLSIFCCFIRRNFKGKGKENAAEKALLHELADANIPPGQYNGEIDNIDKNTNQVHLFSFESLEMATNNFSTTNKLGEGGFGSVYKGKWPSGQEMAIKRLSKCSGQGLLEFKNEILLISELQHDNLVNLLGCCVTGLEKILVYEYMPNRSLDFFIFDPSKRELIKWTNRMNIIEGVAQGLLYLHKYSRLRVIHRDLKASNILLDQNMNPKISDFGMARIFGKQESEANTNRIVGTHGYMSPEYAIKGVFSTKTDVFSFGVLLLEIVSGKKNHGCYHSKRPLNLIGLAWELWVEGRAIELMDPTLDVSNHANEIIRCINVGLLCVQDNATDRPSMTDVISMLTNESLQLPEPKQPAFFIDTTTREAEKEVALEKPCTNDLSISVMEGR